MEISLCFLVKCIYDIRHVLSIRTIICGEIRIQYWHCANLRQELYGLMGSSYKVPGCNFGYYSNFAGIYGSGVDCENQRKQCIDLWDQTFKKNEYIKEIFWPGGSASCFSKFFSFECFPKCFCLFGQVRV